MNDEEEATRTAYGKARQASLPVVEDLAGSPEADAAEPDQPVPPGLTPWLAPDRPAPIAPAVLRTALEAGWLVAAAQPAPADPHDTRRLQGLKVAVKDLIDVAGLPVRNGTPGGLWREPTTSAMTWDRLAGAGACCIGKAATHEMAWGLTTPAIGNPHDPTRYAGGSSGGSGAVIAAGAAHGALGTDTGGSVRVPAALCGVVGIRPTHGSTDLAGVTPLAPSQDVVGPLAQDLDTCAVMLEELLGRPLGPAPGSDADKKAWRVGVLAPPGALEDDVAAAYDRTLIRLSGHGVEVVSLPRIPLREAGTLSVLTMLAESAAIHAPVVREAPGAFGAEFRGVTSAGEALLAARSDVSDLLRRARQTLRVRTAALFAQHRLDAFLTPTTPCVAPLRGHPTLRLGDRDVPVSTALNQFAAWSAATGWPAISVPVPAGPLPVGMQLMARPYREDVCLQLGGLVQARDCR